MQRFPYLSWQYAVEVDLINVVAVISTLGAL